MCEHVYLRKMLPDPRATSQQAVRDLQLLPHSFYSVRRYFRILLLRYSAPRRVNSSFSCEKSHGEVVQPKFSVLTSSCVEEIFKVSDLMAHHSCILLHLTWISVKIDTWSVKTVQAVNMCSRQNSVVCEKQKVFFSRMKKKTKKKSFMITAAKKRRDAMKKCWNNAQTSA